MIDFIDLEGNRHGAITEYSVRHGVNGEKSLSGTVYTNEEVIHGIDKGWRLEVNNEFYVVTFGVPVDTGNRTQLEFDAVHEFFYEMSKDVVYDTLSGSNTATRYLNFIFDGSGYEYRLEIDVPAFSKDNFGMENRLALFKDFVQTTGVEFVVNNRVVRILREVGSDLSTIVKKGFNLQELRLEKNMSEFVTVKRGYGAFFDEENPEAGRLEVEYKSPLVEIFGELHADPIVDERFSVPENLEERLKEDVENSYNISVQLTMEDLTKAGYEYERPETGDYILAMNEDLGFEQRVRIVSYESHYDVEGNIIDHDVTCNSIGVAQRSTGSAGFRNTINRALENAERALEIANHAQVSADGNTMNYYGETDPRELGYEVRLGDTWFQVSGEDRIIQTWNGAEWEPLINTAHTDEVSRRVEEALEEAQDAKAQVERESEERRADIQAESERLSAEWNERIEENEQIVEDVRHSTEELMNDFDRALAQANFTSIEDLTTTLNTRSLEAIENARESIEIAERADGYAIEALDVANGFGTRITDVESTVEGQATSINTAIATAERVERTISEVTNDVDGLSSRFVSMEVDIEGITNTVSDYEGRISRTEQRADGLYDVVHDPNTGLLTEVSQIAEGWQVTAQRIDDIEIGGRNLLRGSSDFSPLFWSAVQSVTTSTMNNNLSMAEVTGQYPNGPHTAMSTQGWNFTIGERYTVSVYARSDNTGQKLGVTAQTVNWQPQDVTSEWRKYSWTFVAHSDTLRRFRFESAPTSSIWITQPKIEKGNKATDWTPAPEDMASQADITVLHNAIDLAVEEGDVIGRLNIQAGHTLIQNGEILMDADTVRFTGSAFIPNAAIEEVSANKIIGNDGQFNTLRSRFLTSNLIESDHLNVTTAMIDRFFANSALIERLTSQQAFIDQLSASNLEVDAARIHGALDAAEVNVIGLNVNDISGLNSEFIRSEWNSAADGTVEITGDGIRSLDSGNELYIAQGAINMSRSSPRNESGTLSPMGLYLWDYDERRAMQINGRGIIFADQFDTSNSSTAFLRFNGTNLVFDNMHLGLRGHHINSVDWLALENSSTVLLSRDQGGGALIDGTQISIGLGSRTGGWTNIAEFYGSIQFYRNTYLNNNNLLDVNRLELANSSTRLLSSSIGGGALIDGTRITIGTGSPSSFNNIAEFTGRINFRRNLWMNGNNIGNVGDLSYSSDERLKEHFSTPTESSLEKHMRLNYQEFDWIDKDRPRTLGLIAQEAQLIEPRLIDDGGDMLAISTSNYLNHLGKSLQELALRELNTNLVASHAYLLAEQHEEEIFFALEKTIEHDEEIQSLKEENKQLKQRIEALEGAA